VAEWGTVFPDVWRRLRTDRLRAVPLTLGSALGLGLAWLGLHELLVIAPANLPRLESIRLDPVVLLFTITAGLLAAAIFGLAPAWRAARPDVMQILRGSGRTSGSRRGKEGPREIENAQRERPGARIGRLAGEPAERRTADLSRDFVLTRFLYANRYPLRSKTPWVAPD